jgi:hypothetical protein
MSTDTDTKPTMLEAEAAVSPSVTSEGPTPVAAKPAWTTTYDSLQSRLPPAISSRLPASTTAAETVCHISTRLSTLSTTSKEHFGELQRSGSKRVDKMRAASSKKLAPEALFACAWSVTNETQVPINVSLNQVCRKWRSRRAGADPLV